MVIKNHHISITTVGWCHSFHCEPEYRVYTKYDVQREVLMPLDLMLGVYKEQLHINSAGCVALAHET